MQQVRQRKQLPHYADIKMVTANRNQIDGFCSISTIKTTSSHQRKQLSSFILFISVIIFINLCPFHPELSFFEKHHQNDDVSVANKHFIQSRTSQQLSQQTNEGFIDKSLTFIKLMFTNPIEFDKKRAGFGRVTLQAEARVIGKVAKMWYIKKKIKKLSKKLKKHTIAVPVFTAIPIYEHSYYPQPHVTHVSHAGMHHAASSYAPAVTPASVVTSQAAASQPAQQMATSASSNYQQMVHPYRPMAGAGHHYHHHNPYDNQMGAGSHQIINSYAPSPPLFVDQAGDIYGRYGNAYSNVPYNGGFSMWN